MPDTIKLLASGSCPIAPTDVFTAVAPTSVLAIDVTNPTGFLQSVTVKLAGVDLFVVPMPQGGGMSWHGPQLLAAGAKINVVAGDAACSYTITGVEIT